MILTMSIIISNVLAFSIWPSSAISDLRLVLLDIHSCEVLCLSWQAIDDRLQRHLLGFGMFPLFTPSHRHTNRERYLQLRRITNSYLAASNEEIQSSKFVQAAANRRTVFSSLMKHLQDAQYEHYFWGTEQEHHQERLLVESMQVCLNNPHPLHSILIGITETFTEHRWS